MYSSKRCVSCAGTVVAVPLFLALAAGVSLGGCGDDKKEAAVPVTLKVSGSTTHGPALQRIGDAYHALYPNVSFEFAFNDSAAGVVDVGSGASDLATVSRPLKSTELATYPDLKEVAVARDGIAVIVQTGNPVASFTFEQLKIIYTGHNKAGDAVTPPRNWIDLTGGAYDHTIVPRRRPLGGGTPQFFNDTVCDKDNAVEPNVMVQVVPETNQSLHDDVMNDVSLGAMAYIGLAFTTGVRVVPVARDAGSVAVVATPETVRDNTYPISRGLYVITLGEATGTMKNFIDFAVSNDGQAIMVEEGFVALQ
jgi:phosphate transport system substrate-binding protein